ncbi:hypothetical protein TRFO_16774 [Tritrichomonas foetus]|uniref:N-acetylgalactosaminide beta-1,3-galactosyltransferase n=1 Tax=Tritrichomonas foetus TaxID=1144522 RepID=A0A1J4KPJ0_9EUKA|nr:hypothetical protein TRFO_16774 [Tritrichomonas foetus]|eukprot:OHT13207.1 hypothetical protein TRFO_16774 [Tritrichomonas foetus]
MMIFLFVFFSRQLTYDDMGFAVWSGREYTTRRVVSQAATWYQLVPEIHVYSDAFFDNSIELVLNESNKTNIIFHEFGHKGKHLIGSEWEHRWYYAQTRHLLTMADFYERFPNKKWYIWGDDDTYLYPESILNFLSSQNSSDFLVFGVSYCSWDSIAEIIEPKRNCHPFAQGGAGVFFSHNFMSSIAPFLRNCSEMFNDPNFAGSMRLAICVERFIGVDKWDMGTTVINLSPRLHSSNPLQETEKGVKFPLSFHRMRHTLLYKIWNATESIWIDGNEKDRHVSWDNITMSTFYINLGNDKKKMVLHWGFRMRIEHSEKTFIYAITRPEPVFEPGDKEKIKPIMYNQEFEGGVTLRYICSDGFDNDEMSFDSYLWPEKEGTAFLINCPKSKLFPVQSKIKQELKLIPKDPSMC